MGFQIFSAACGLLSANMLLLLPITRLEIPFRGDQRTELSADLISKQPAALTRSKAQLGKDVLPLIRNQVLQEELGLGCLSGDACRFLPGLVREQHHPCGHEPCWCCIPALPAFPYPVPCRGVDLELFFIVQCSRIDFHAAGRRGCKSSNLGQ